MPRVKNGAVTKARHKKVLKRAKSDNKITWKPQ